MRALSKSKRIHILQQDEIDSLFEIPIFNDDEREKWFDLNKQEQSLLKSKKTIERKVDFIIQLGYFKAKHQFFIFTLDEVKNDVHYILHHLFSGEKFKKTNIKKHKDTVISNRF